MVDYSNRLVRGFLAKSMPAVRALTKRVQEHKEEEEVEGFCREVSFLCFGNVRNASVVVDGAHFYLRGSVEYANPQLTVEELQGIIGMRLLQTCVNYCLETGMREPTEGDYYKLCDELKVPSRGYVLPFLLNTDDVEADRYSINPLKRSLVDSGQSAFPVANIKTEQLCVDKEFVEKYEGSLISKEEVDLISEELLCHDNYMDFVDAVKFRQLEALSKVFGIDFSLYALRMPLSALQAEKKGDVLHYIISDVHKSVESIKQAYDCMGRSITKRTTLLTVPHSKKGYGSKRAAHGRIYFDGNNNSLLEVNVKYQPTVLYSNGIDPKDVSITVGEDSFRVEGEKFVNYSYAKTPSSPQFFLYALASPEDAVLWHGIGAFASSQLLQTYLSAHRACNNGQLIMGLHEKFNLPRKMPVQFNLVPEGMWRHCLCQNIDASIGVIKDFEELINRDLWIEHLIDEYTQKPALSLPHVDLLMFDILQMLHNIQTTDNNKVNNENNGEVMFLECFRGFDKVVAVRELFGEKTVNVLSNLKVEFDTSNGYMHVDGDDGHIIISKHYLQRGDKTDIYLDLIHELCHVKQFMNGKNLFDRSYEYVDRPTEIEAYHYTVEEARRIGLTEERIYQYLKTEWINDAALKRLARAVNLKLEL